LKGCPAPALAITLRLPLGRPSLPLRRRGR
jgi:hypothetical protein